MDMISFINQSAFYFGSIFVAISCLIYTVIRRNMDKPQTRIFLSALWIMIITSICNMVAIYVEPYCDTNITARTALFVSNYLYFVLHNLLALFLCYYSFFATQSFIRMKRATQLLYMVPFLVSEFFMVSNPLNHWSWTYDSEYHFQRGWAEGSVYIAGGIYSIIALYYLLFRWYAATKKRKLMIVVAFAMTAFGVAIQAALPKLEVELFFETLNFLGVMLSVEYDDDRVDAVTRLFNRNAFIRDARYYYDTHSHFHAVILKLTNYETYQKMPDAYDINEVVAATAAGLNRLYYRFTTYRVTPSCFVLLVINKDQAFVDHLSLQINAFLAEGLGLSKKDERIAGVIMQAEIPGEIHSLRELLMMCEMDFKEFSGGRVMKHEDLHELFERAEIERAIREGLSEHRFEVYYQMIYTSKDDRVHAAEALLRLKDPELGELMPRVFIPEAERSGMIDVLGEFVLREVCRFIKKGIPDKFGMRYINVNLSVLQCMQPHFVERMKNIVYEEGIAPSRINFEITESVAAEDYDYLARVMRECRRFGFLFAMEGYGSGYSNMYAVFSLDFDEIKLDKTMLWEADKNEHGRIILENSIRMIHEMKRPVVAVGVETVDQVERLKMLDVEYLQGFYYAKPQSVTELSQMEMDRI